MYLAKLQEQVTTRSQHRDCNVSGSALAIVYSKASHQESVFTGLYSHLDFEKLNLILFGSTSKH